MSDTVDPRHITQIIEEAHDYFADADRRERNADERAKKIADAHREGWRDVARAINDGFRLIADAIKSR